MKVFPPKQPGKPVCQDSFASSKEYPSAKKEDVPHFAHHDSYIGLCGGLLLLGKGSDPEGTTLSFSSFVDFFVSIHFCHEEVDNCLHGVTATTMVFCDNSLAGADFMCCLDRIMDCDNPVFLNSCVCLYHSARAPVNIVSLCATSHSSSHKHAIYPEKPRAIVQQRLLDLSQPLTKRMRVVCSLRAVKGEGTIEALASCMNDESALLRHEVAYALGQKEEVSAVPILIHTLRNDEDTMVRHEAAEALGAIQAAEAEAVLQEYENCEVEEVAHTCQLALDRIRWARKKAESQATSESAHIFHLQSILRHVAGQSNHANLF
jgi:hypothetical protein